MDEQFRELREEFIQALWSLELFAEGVENEYFCNEDEMNEFLWLHRRLVAWRNLTNKRVERDHKVNIPKLERATDKNKRCEFCRYFFDSYYCHKFPSDIANTNDYMTCPEHEPGISERK